MSDTAPPCIRRFRKDDAAFCFRIRVQAFQSVFRDEIGEDAVTGGINAYQPVDYQRMAEDAEFFIIEYQRESAGFFILRRIDRQTAELFLLYIDLRHLGKGLGSRCCAFLESWIAQHWPDVNRIRVDTVIPNYNARFYRQMGYFETGMTDCRFPGITLPAVRLEKNLNSHLCNAALQ